VPRDNQRSKSHRLMEELALEAGFTLTDHRLLLTQVAYLSRELLGRPVEVRDGRRRKKLGTELPNLLKMPHPARNEFCIAHAVAHLMTPEDCQRHGATFMAHYLRLLELQGLIKNAIVTAEYAKQREVRVDKNLVRKTLHTRRKGPIRVSTGDSLYQTGLRQYGGRR